MLPSSLEYDGTIWWRVDDLWWSFLPTWSFPCLSYSWASCLLYRTPTFSFFYHVILLSFLLWILTLCLDLLLLSFQRVRATRAWEEEEHWWIIFRGVGLLPSHLNFYVTQPLKSSVNVKTSLRVCCYSHVLRYCSSSFVLISVGEGSLILGPLNWTSPLHLTFLWTIRSRR